MAKLRVMLVDDHNIVRAGLRLLVNNQADMEVVAEAENRDDALKCTRRAPDVVVLDLSLPGGPSLPLIDQIRGGRRRACAHPDHARRPGLCSRGGSRPALMATWSRPSPKKTLLEGIHLPAHAGRMFVDLDDEVRTASVFQSFPQNPGPGAPSRGETQRTRS